MASGIFGRQWPFVSGKLADIGHGFLFIPAFVVDAYVGPGIHHSISLLSSDSTSARDLSIPQYR